MKVLNIFPFLIFLMTRVRPMGLVAESYDSRLRCQRHLNGLIQSKCLRRGIQSARGIKAGFVVIFMRNLGWILKRLELLTVIKY